MTARFAASLLLLLVPGTVVAQNPETSGKTRLLHTLGGSVSFEVPRAWHILRETDSTVNALFVYYILDPAVDSVSDDRTNVVINTYVRSGQTFREGTDGVLGGIIDSSMIVLDDSVAGPDQRVVFWRGQEGRTVYVGFDDFARSGDQWIHIRIAFPLVEHSSKTWMDDFSAQCRALLHSMRFGAKKAFPVDGGYPVLSAYGPGSP